MVLTAVYQDPFSPMRPTPRRYRVKDLVVTIRRHTILPYALRDREQIKWRQLPLLGEHYP